MVWNGRDGVIGSVPGKPGMRGRRDTNFARLTKRGASHVRLDYGDLTIQGVGEGTQTISTIASPLAFRNAITTRPVGT
jgi:hypothetical protein